MRAFDYVRAARIDDAIAALADPGTRCLAGGTNLLDLMKGYVEQPTRLVDITRLPLAEIEPLADGGLRIGALVSNSDLANARIVRERYPLLAQALVAGASPQLRNMASVGGNLLQRTRCHYFVDVGFDACNKRKPGSGCAAREGSNRIHAILGASDACIAVHPSDMCVALAALDALVEARSTQGLRRIPMDRFHRLPGTTPERDTELRRDELITAVVLPPSPFADHSHYLKVRDRASYEFALVSIAAALDMDGDRVRDARIALGGVAHRPWRASRAEQVLIGRVLDDDTLARAALAATEGARPYRDNAFKVTLAQRAVGRALREAASA
ncbi:MAG TPA: xanthine dehydrogenase family protein subunit M [Casimicrobiaceae bacterium]|nr:xanthine dehydrogenase family protein subunit M [Casimicrobiaceae bacterium]